MIKIQDICKLYTAKKEAKAALSNINLVIHEGEILALLGVNGAGKTTLSSIIASLIPASSGHILFHGECITKNLFAYRRHIGFCPQKQNLDKELTLEENLTFQGRYYGMKKKAIKRRVEKLLNTFNLEEYRAMKSEVLSGGYKQRFLIARALIHNPKLVILDEPSVGLDPQVRYHLWDIIKQIKNDGVSTLLTTHYLDEAEYLADRVCIIDQGKIKTINTSKNLKEDLKLKNLEEVFLKIVEENDE